MKKLLLLSVVLLLFAGCSKDETTSSGQADQTEAFVPHFYGAAMLPLLPRPVALRTP